MIFASRRICAIVRREIGIAIAVSAAIVIGLNPAVTRSYPGDTFVVAAHGAGPVIAAGGRDATQRYAVSSRTGASEYSIPLFVPPGRNGIEPSLALSYSSRNPLRGNLASGWTLDVPAIRVDTSVGRLDGTHYLSTLADGQRLVAVEEPGASARVEAFRGEQDGTYTRYEKFPVDNGASWRALSPDGTLYHFGTSPESRDRPGEYATEGRWSLSRFEDRFGNAVIFDYETVYGRALNGRLRDVPVDFALRRIRYTVNERAGIDAHARILFDYAEAFDLCPGSDVPIGSSFDYRSGIRIYEGARRLLRIVTQVRQSPAADWQDRRIMEFDYDQSALRCDQLHAPLRVLTNIRQRAWNLDGEPSELPTRTFAYSRLQHELSVRKPSSLLDQQTTRSLGQGKRRINRSKAGGWPTVDGMLLDLDGDGRQDWLRAFETDNDVVCSFEWNRQRSFLPALPWANTRAPPGTFGARNEETTNPHRLEGCNLAYQLSRRENLRHSGFRDCAGTGSNYTSYRFMDLDGDGDQDLVTALDFKRGRYNPRSDPALRNDRRYGAYPECTSPPPCRDPQGKAVPCKTDSLIGFLTMPPLLLPLGSGSSGAVFSAAATIEPDDLIFPDIGAGDSSGRCPGNLCTPGICPPESLGDFADPCRCGQCFISACNPGEWAPPEVGRPGSGCADDWNGNPFADGLVGKEDSPPQFGGNPWCAQEPEMACFSDRGFSRYVWRVYWNGSPPGGAPEDDCPPETGGTGSFPICNPSSEVGPVIGDPESANSIDIFGATRKPTVVFSPIPLESDRPTSSLGAGNLAASSSWHGFVDIDGDGFLDAVWQDPGTRGHAGVTGTDWPGPGPTGRFLVFRGDGEGRFLSRHNGEPYEWRTPPLGNLRARINVRRSHDKYPLRSFNQRVLNTEIHRFTEAIVTLRDINGDHLPDYIESRPLDDGRARLRVFFNVGDRFEHGFARGERGTVLTDDFATLSREETVVLTIENNRQMKNGWGMAVRRVVDLDQDGRPDVALLKPPIVGQRDPWDSPTASAGLYDFEGVPPAVVAQFPEVPLEDPDQPAFTPYINVGDRLIRIDREHDVRHWRHGLARYRLSSSGRWVVKTDLLDIDGDGMLDLYNNGEHAAGNCVPTPRSTQGNPLFDTFGGEYSFALCGQSSLIAGDSDPRQGMRLLTMADNGQGGVVRFDYAPITDRSVVADDPGTDRRTPAVIWVVRSMTLQPGFGAAGTTEYHYTHPVYNRDRQRRFGFRGFEEVAILRPQNSLGIRGRTIERFDYRLDFSGRKTAELVIDDSDRVHSVTATEWREMALFGGAVTTFVKRQVRTWFCDSSNDRSEDACRNGGALKRRLLAWAPVQVNGEPDPEVFERAYAIGNGAGADYRGRDRTPIEGATAAGSAVGSAHEHAGAAAAGNAFKPAPTRDPLCAKPIGPVTQPLPGISKIAVIVVQCAERLTDANGPVRTGDRGVQQLSELVYGPERYQLLLTQTRHFVATEESTTSAWGATRPTARKQTIFDPARMGLALETRVGINPDETAITRRTFDLATANLRTIQQPNEVAEDSAKATSIDYDAFRINVRLSTNELGHQVETGWDLGLGKPISVKGPLQTSGLPEERTIYDGFGRVLEQYRSVDRPDGGYATKRFRRTTYFDAEIPPRQRLEQLIEYDGPAAITTDTTFDGLGRTLDRLTRSAAGPERASYRYDPAGNLVTYTTTSPRDDSSSVVYRYEHDTEGRVTRWIPPLGAAAETVYDGLVASTTELPADGGAASRVTTTQDVFGRISSVGETLANGDEALTRYAYDARDRLQKVTDADGTVTELEHDFMGRRTAIHRSGRTWRYRYDPNGNMTAQIAPHPEGTDEAHYTTSTLYDVLNRPSVRSPAPRGLAPAQLERFKMGPIRYHYDQPSTRNGVGRLGRVTSPLGLSAYHYSAEGWITEERFAFEIDPFDTGAIADTRKIRRRHNALGLPSIVAHADNDDDPTITLLEYDERGLPVEVALLVDLDPISGQITKTPIASVRHNRAGLPKLRRSAGQQHRWSYDDRGRIVDHRVAVGAQLMAGESVRYTDTGDVESVANLATGLRLDFSYDRQHQLQGVASSDALSYDAGFRYSPAGRVTHSRIASTTDSGNTIRRDLLYDYSRKVTDLFPHDPGAVRRLLTDDGAGPPFATFEYDPSGNLVRRIAGDTATDFVFGGYDHLLQATTRAGTPQAQREVYYYTPDGQRTLAFREGRSGNPGTVRFWFGDSEITYGADGTQQQALVRVDLGAQPVARLTRGAPGPEFSYHGVLRHLLAVLAEDGSVKARFGYGPYGEVLSAFGPGTERHRRRFNDKQHDVLTDLYYYGFRYYDPLTLNWTQADPRYRFSPDLALTEPRRMNLYTFSLNNPLRYIDPDGLDPDDVEIRRKLEALEEAGVIVLQSGVEYRDIGSHPQESVRGDKLKAEARFQAFTQSPYRLYVRSSLFDYDDLSVNVIFYHESLHRDQFDATGQPRTISQMGRYEIEAYEKSADYVKSLTDSNQWGLSAEDFETLKEDYERQFRERAAVARWVVICGETESFICNFARKTLNIPDTDAKMRQMYNDEAKDKQPPERTR